MSDTSISPPLCVESNFPVFAVTMSHHSHHTLTRCSSFPNCPWESHDISKFSSFWPPSLWNHVRANSQTTDRCRQNWMESNPVQQRISLYGVLQKSLKGGLINPIISYCHWGSCEHKPHLDISIFYFLTSVPRGSTCDRSNISKREAGVPTLVYSSWRRIFPIFLVCAETLDSFDE